MKRLFDFVIAALGLTFSLPILLPAMLAVYLQDKHSPFYIADRVGLQEKLFRMYKLRSMIKNADKAGVDSTASDDRRITKVGHLIRKFKLDELTQLINVLLGDMSMVGPRPNVKRETDLYTPAEKQLLQVRPGITDFSSIVFADEGEILAGSSDPDLDYNQLIRPWKSRLGIFYVEHHSLLIDVKLVFFTALAIVDRQMALRKVSELLRDLGAVEELVAVASRTSPLKAAPPPGAAEIVQSRNNNLSQQLTPSPGV